MANLVINRLTIKIKGGPHALFIVNMQKRSQLDSGRCSRDCNGMRRGQTIQYVVLHPDDIASEMKNTNYLLVKFQFQLKALEWMNQHFWDLRFSFKKVQRQINRQVSRLVHYTTYTVSVHRLAIQQHL